MGRPWDGNGVFPQVPDYKWIMVVLESWPKRAGMNSCAQIPKGPSEEESGPANAPPVGHTIGVDHRWKNPADKTLDGQLFHLGLSRWAGPRDMAFSEGVLGLLLAA